MKRECDICGSQYEARRVTSRYCSTRCRTTATRKGQSRPRGSVTPIRTAPTPDAEVTPGPIEAATLAELELVDRAATAAGQRALMLARLLDAPPALSLSSVSGWSAQHSAALAEATAGVERPRPKTALDLAREKRDAKRHA